MHDTLDEFIATQKLLIAECGLESFLPVLWVVTRRRVDVNVLTESETDELIIREWALEIAGKHDYCLAFRFDETHFKVVARICGTSSEQVVELTA